MQESTTRKIGICIPTYNRSEMTVRAFANVYNDERIQEINISDDASEPQIYYHLQNLTAGKTKVKLHRLSSNSDCYFNKWVSLCIATCKWNILLDSDNVIYTSYLDRLFDIDNWDSKTIYTPSFAAPAFDFKEYEGLTISKENVSSYIDKPLFEVMLNAANYFVNKDEYLKIWDGSLDPVTSDSIYMMLKWFEAGNKLFVVPNLSYDHTIHPSSHYLTQNHRTPKGFHESILQKLKEMA